MRACSSQAALRGALPPAIKFCDLEHSNTSLVSFSCRFGRTPLSPTNADRDGRGPFWAACATRDTKIAARLLQAGADVDEQDNNGVTALRYAVAHGNADVAEFLRAHGAAEVEGGRLSISPSAAGGEVPETFTNPSPRSAGEASSAAASL